MANKTWKFSQRAAVAAVSLLLGTAAQAGLVRGSLDPAATLFIPAYNGFADFEVADACLVGDGWKATGSSGGCGAVYMQSATVYLYGSNPGVDNPSNSPLNGTANFGTFSESFVTGILVENGEVLGIDSAVMGFVSGGPGPYSSQNFWLQFVTGCLFGDSDCSTPPQIQQLQVAPLAFEDANPRALLFNSVCVPTDFDDECVFQPGPNPSPTTRLTFAAVPEPGTLGLILAALGGGWLARRRKKKTAA